MLMEEGNFFGSCGIVYSGVELYGDIGELFLFEKLFLSCFAEATPLASESGKKESLSRCVSNLYF